MSLRLTKAGKPRECNRVVLIALDVVTGKLVGAVAAFENGSFHQGKAPKRT